MTLPALLLNDLPLWRLALVGLPPGVLLLAWAVAAAQATPSWAVAKAASAAALGLALAGLLAVGVAGPGQWMGWRSDLVGATVSLLVAFIGWVIVRYSATYLEGEARVGAYLRALMLALASVLVVVSSNHLALLAGAWTLTSLAVHRLLNFFDQRPQARWVAHKKFVFARVADVAVWLACALLLTTYGTGRLDLLLSQVQAGVAPPLATQVAVLLVVIAALLKCAQLPFHGWLIQVMEAPTPVSALLHAGVVNLGGLVLIRLAPLVSEVPAAMTTLTVVGGLSAVLAALVMSTRISVKVMLAWSTAAQMGFMLMQCGLGLWEMALLHLVAHSLYKAHAFLSSGGVVRQAQVLSLATPAPLRAMHWAGALLGSAVLVASVFGLAQLLRPASLTPALATMACVLALAWVPLLVVPGSRRRGAVVVLALSAAYAVLHGLLQPLVAPGAVYTPATGLLLGVVAAFAALFAAQSLLRLWPDGSWARRLYPWVYGGWFLDERLSQLLFRRGPGRLA
jgi:NAD(P)H-quinone oxidoreductase subunit 5